MSVQPVDPKLSVTPCLLCGPGPSNPPPQVITAMTLPPLGYMDKEFLKVYDDIRQLLKYAWQTNNDFTIPITGSATAAWEAVIGNLTEPGDVHLVFVSGYFGDRHCEMAGRYGAKVIREDSPGKPFSLKTINEAIRKYKPDLVWICHGETSTGVRQNLSGVGEICRQLDALLVLDTVTTLGGVETRLDDWLIDASYSGAQKCLSGPAGISMLTLGERALAKMRAKRTPCRSWYLDLRLIEKYLYGDKRQYHHTPPAALLYALREALVLVTEEGLEKRWKRHQEQAALLWELLKRNPAFTLEVADEHERLAPLTLVEIRTSKDEDAVDKVVKFCREKYHLEIGKGFGPLAKEAVRIGLMGYNARPGVVYQIVAALEDAAKTIDL